MATEMTLKPGWLKVDMKRASERVEIGSREVCSKSTGTYSSTSKNTKDMGKTTNDHPATVTKDKHR